MQVRLQMRFFDPFAGFTQLCSPQVFRSLSPAALLQALVLFACAQCWKLTGEMRGAGPER